MSTKPNTSQITYDTGSNKQDLNNILDTVVPITDYTALRNYTGRATQVRITADGISGFFKYDATDTTSTDNGGTIIVSGTKRWKRHFDGSVNVKWFGAKGDGITDDTVAIQNAIDSLPLNIHAIDVMEPKGFANGGGVFIPRGRYKVTGTVNLQRGIVLFGEGKESSQLISFTSGSVLQYLDAGRYIQDEITVEKLSIWQDGSVTATSGAAIEIVNGPATVDSISPSIRDVLIEGTYQGIALSAGVAGSIRDCNISRCVSHNVAVKYAAGLHEKTTSTTIYNTYSHLSQTGSGFYFDNSNYVSVIGGASDSNARYGYELNIGSAYSITGGAEGNTLGGIYAKNTYGLSAYVDIFDTAASDSSAITLDTTFGTVLSGVLHTGAVSTGYGINLVASGGPIVALNIIATGNWGTDKFTNNEAQLLVIGKNANGFVGGVNNRWAFGAVSSPSLSTQFGVGGEADATVNAGLLVDPVFTAAGTSNTTEVTHLKTANTVVTYALCIAKYIRNATKGAASTIVRACGLVIDDQTAGGTANANIMIGGTTPSAGTWNIFSQSSRDSVWYGKHRFLSSTGPTLSFGTGSPEGVVTAPVGSQYGRTDGGAGTSFYVKESGTGNTGWVAK